jgi:DNA modification methylase
MINYNQVLPIRRDCRIDDQFGWLPLSVIEPSRDHREQWPEAYLDDGLNESKRSKDAANLPGLRYSEFHAGLAEQVLRYWSMKGSVVVDPFAGRATRAVVASKLGRQYEGYEVSPTTYKRVTEHFKKLGVSPKLYNNDGTILTFTENESADLVFTCPPYHNLEKYESATNQLSECETYEKFMKQIGFCGYHINRVLKPGAFCVWVVADWRDMTGSGLRSFHSDLITAFVNEGMVHHDTIIMKNLSPFAFVQCAKVASKRYTSKIHEYIMVFRKQGEYEIPDYCEQDELRVNSNKFFSYE